MNNNAPPSPSSDSIYKRLYSFRRMVEDLLRSIFDDAELGADYRTLEKLPAEYVGDALQQRRGDTVWRLRAANAVGGWLHVLVMIEFQSGAEAAMALRVLEYTALLYRELLRRGDAKPGALPPVLPLVLYNGDAPWRPANEMRALIAETPKLLAPYQPSQRHLVLDERRAREEDFKLRELTWAVTRLEQSRSKEDLWRAARHLAQLLPDEGELRRAFADWLWTLGRRLEPGEPPSRPPENLDLEEVAMSLEERVAEWPKPYIEQGREEGIILGREEGREEGISLGREQGISLLLRHLAVARFDAATADRLAAAIEGEADPKRLMAVGEAIVRCETGGELLREIASRR